MKVHTGGPFALPSSRTFMPKMEEKRERGTKMVAKIVMNFIDWPCRIALVASWMEIVLNIFKSD